MKKLIIAALAVLMMCGCSAVTEDTNETVSAPEKTTTAQAQTEKQTTNAEETSSEQTTEPSENTGESKIWFDKGVYEGKINDATEVYYCFYDEKSGKMLNANSGMGVGFTCEQMEDKIIFHMGALDNESIMTISSNTDGSIVGNFADNDISYTFTAVADADPESFTVDTQETLQTEVQPAEDDLFAGSYYEKIAGRGRIDITPAENNVYNVLVRWSNSNADYYEWEMSGEFSGKQVLDYTDCTKMHVTYDENGNETRETEYTDGTGYLKATEIGIFWKDNKEGVADNTSFTKN